MDLATMTDEELDTLRRDCLIEQERRSTVASASARIQSTVAQAEGAGVAEEVIRAAVETGLTQASAMAPKGPPPA